MEMTMSALGHPGVPLHGMTDMPELAQQLQLVQQERRGAENNDEYHQLSTEVMSIDRNLGRLLNDVTVLRGDQDVLARGLTELEEQVIQKLDESETALEEKLEEKFQQVMACIKQSSPTITTTAALSPPQSSGEDSDGKGLPEGIATKTKQKLSQNADSSATDSVNDGMVAINNTQSDISKALNDAMAGPIASILEHVEGTDEQIKRFEAQLAETTDLCQNVLSSMSKQMQRFQTQLKNKERESFEEIQTHLREEFEHEFRQNGEQILHQVFERQEAMRDAMSQQLRGVIGKDLKHQVSNDLKQQVSTDLKQQLRSEITAELRYTIVRAVRDEIRNEMQQQLKNDLKRELRQEMKHELRQELRHELLSEIKENITTNLQKQKTSLSDTQIEKQNSDLAFGALIQKKMNTLEEEFVSIKRDFRDKQCGIEKQIIASDTSMRENVLQVSTYCDDMVRKRIAEVRDEIDRKVSSTGEKSGGLPSVEKLENKVMGVEEFEKAEKAQDSTSLSSPTPSSPKIPAWKERRLYDRLQSELDDVKLRLGNVEAQSALANIVDEPSSNAKKKYLSSEDLPNHLGGVVQEIMEPLLEGYTKSISELGDNFHCLDSMFREFLGAVESRFSEMGSAIDARFDESDQHMHTIGKQALAALEKDVAGTLANDAENNGKAGASSDIVANTDANPEIIKEIQLNEKTRKEVIENLQSQMKMLEENYIQTQLHLSNRMEKFESFDMGMNILGDEVKEMNRELSNIKIKLKKETELKRLTPRVRDLSQELHAKMSVLEKSLKTVLAQSTQDNTEAFRILMQMVRTAAGTNSAAPSTTATPMAAGHARLNSHAGVPSIVVQKASNAQASNNPVLNPQIQNNAASTIQNQTAINTQLNSTRLNAQHQPPQQNLLVPPRVFAHRRARSNSAEEQSYETSAPSEALDTNVTSGPIDHCNSRLEETLRNLEASRIQQQEIVRTSASVVTGNMNRETVLGESVRDGNSSSRPESRAESRPDSRMESKTGVSSPGVVVTPSASSSGGIPAFGMGAGLPAGSAYDTRSVDARSGDGRFDIRSVIMSSDARFEGRRSVNDDNRSQSNSYSEEQLEYQKSLHHYPSSFEQHYPSTSAGHQQYPSSTSSISQTYPSSVTSNTDPRDRFENVKIKNLNDMQENSQSVRSVGPQSVRSVSHSVSVSQHDDEEHSAGTTPANTSTKIDQKTGMFSIFPSRLTSSVNGDQKADGLSSSTAGSGGGISVTNLPSSQMGLSLSATKAPLSSKATGVPSSVSALTNSYKDVIATITKTPSNRQLPTSNELDISSSFSSTKL